MIGKFFKDGKDLWKVVRSHEGHLWDARMIKEDRTLDTNHYQTVTGQFILDNEQVCIRCDGEGKILTPHTPSTPCHCQKPGAKIEFVPALKASIRRT